MKILILANNDVGLYQFRGELIETLLKKHNVVISLPNGEMVPLLEKMGCHFLDTSVDRRGINPVKDLRLFCTYWRILGKEKPDYVVTYTIKPNIYGGIVCRLRKISYATNITGLGTAFQKDGILKRLVTVMYRVALKHANTVFFENCENQQIFVDARIVEHDRVCLLNGAGVNLEKFPIMEYPFGKITKFLFIGRVMREKGIEELLAVMSRLAAEGTSCELDIVGDYEENYKEVMEHSESEGWLHYHGYQKDVRPYISRCHCFVLPSWHEGMANTNLECAASGRPVITSNIHGCLEAVEDGVTGYLVQKGNQDDLYRTMKKFLALSYDQRRSMGAAGRKRMEHLFDKQQVVNRTCGVLFGEENQA